METSTILLLILSLAVSLAIGYFQYYFRTKNIGKITPLLFLLRSLSLFLLLLLFINPTIERTSFKNEKPALSILIDNSESTSFFQQDSLVNSILTDVKKSDLLNNKFDINYYSFGEEVQLNDSLTFEESQTNIYNALSTLQGLNKGKENPIILISDGNQTLGNDYEYINSKKPIYPVVIGDTTKYEDLAIDQLNANRFSFLNNQFPIEAIVLYEGNENIKAGFTIEHKGKIVYRKTLNFSSNKSTQTVRTNLKSDKEGINFYRAKIEYLNEEKNKSNNIKNFSIEVIDKQSQILILSSLYHPDLGSLKKSIEKDQQRKVSIKLIGDNYKLKDYQLVVLYQPNSQFKGVIDEIKKEKINYFLITGSKTNWNFINTQELGLRKNSINQSENYSANYNAGYLIFSQKDIGFNDFPPLIDKFGQTTISIPYQTLLYQSINGFSSKEPLLFTADESNHKKVFLLGEGIWKWRSTSFLKGNTFENFDEFIGNIIQYASSKKIRKRLDLDINSIYNANSTIRVGAFYVDNNFEFDNRATLLLTVANKNTNEVKSIPFSLEVNSYQAELEALESGEYEYTVTVEGQNITQKGSFRVSEYSVEEQFTNANKDKLQRLANRTNGKLYNKDQTQLLFDDLLNNAKYATVQKSIQKKENLVDWLWVLLLIVGLLTIEWFTRKYHGKI
ncbi:vWA domain-containing protein [Pseudotenacibaculum sp. MALMAid0570]|uniref:vWA domain-containing protein n=1 Tax=Pseudotenacibaculum sp. MALMAid0570 TaxID=3143938 RepID=UPI0032E01032